MTGSTIFERIWDAHCIADLGANTRLLLIDRILLHERTGGIALKTLEEAGRPVRSPENVFVTMDHIVDTFPGRGDKTLMPTGTEFIVQTREAALRAGVTLYDLGDNRQGIVHVISPEQAIILPGTTLVCPDSHTGTQGAMGALAWGIGSSEAEHALATSTLRVNRPKQMRISVEGSLNTGVTAKDLALHIVAAIGSNGARGHMVEFAGAAVRALPMEARLTLCNMATEIGAFSAIIAPDEVTISYLTGRALAPTGKHWKDAVAYWRALPSDEDAVFDQERHFDAKVVVPMISWGTSPEQAIPVSGRLPADGSGPGSAAKHAADYMAVTAESEIAGLPIDGAFIGSCTNSRLDDLRRIAAIVKGRKVARGVKAICVPGSMAVKISAEAEGIDIILKDAGFEWREPGCSMCFFAGGESFGRNERIISSTNRNFENRQGPATRTHIASPETVAASALLGRIASAIQSEDAS